MCFQGSQMLFAQLMAGWRGKGGSRWLEYPFHKSHHIIRGQPSKLAAWIGENLGQELQIPPKWDVEWSQWTVGELNAILENNLVPSHRGKKHLRTFGCIQWECELYMCGTVEGPRHDAIRLI
jgi:hypothetical protein